MKKPSKRAQLWGAIHAQNSNHRRLTSKRKAKIQRRLHSHSYRPNRQDLLAKGQNRVNRSAPEHLSFFSETADETIRFNNRIRSAVDRKSRVLLDFSRTVELTAAGLVYLYSEIEDIRAKFGQSAVRINVKNVPRATKWALRESGILDLTNGGPQPRGEMLPIATGEDDQGLVNIVDYLIGQAISGRHLGAINIDQAEQLTGSAIEEAMLNVKYHAYPNQGEKRWWLTSAILDAQLFIALCDRGVGIPETLPTKGWFEQIRRLLPMDDDAHMIKAAMEYARSSQSEKSRRGLGTRDIQRLVLEQHSGRLTIVSGKGHYRLSGKSGKETATALREDVGGTVIQWTIPMQAGQEDA